MIAAIVILVMLLLGVLLTIGYFPRIQRPQFSGKKLNFETSEDLTPHLEGDSPNVDIHALEAPPMRYEIPDRYNENYIALVVRDPEWLFAYWEVSNATKEELAATHPHIFSESVPVLRVFNITNGKEEHCFDLSLAEDATRCHFHVQKPNNKFYVVFGRKKASGEFIPILYSNPVRTPRASVSPELDPDWLPPSAYAHLLFKGANPYSSAELFKKRSD